MYVNPARLVSCDGRFVAARELSPKGAFCCCRTTQVKVKVSSSSFDSRRINVGGWPGAGSGSWMYSMGVSSLGSRLAENLVAGKALVEV